MRTGLEWREPATRPHAPDTAAQGSPLWSSQVGDVDGVIRPGIRAFRPPLSRSIGGPPVRMESLRTERVISVRRSTSAGGAWEVSRSRANGPGRCGRSTAVRENGCRIDST